MKRKLNSPLNIGKVIKGWRWANKIGIREGAQRIGLRTSTLCRLEQGKEISGANLAQVVRWLLF